MVMPDLFDSPQICMNLAEHRRPQLLCKINQCVVHHLFCYTVAKPMLYRRQKGHPWQYLKRLLTIRAFLLYRLHSCLCHPAL